MPLVGLLFCMLSLIALPVSAENTLNQDQVEIPAFSKAQLGQILFFDTNLSKNRSQSCATCHNPDHAFIDDRDSKVDGMVSQGDDLTKFGDRNTPTASYANKIPRITRSDTGVFKGGLFFDGRQRDLAGQAGEPLLNPVEMGMGSKTEVVGRLLENTFYEQAFKDVYGDAVFDDVERAYEAMTDSIAEFEKSDFFSPFDSKYDRYLRNEVEFTRLESLGEALFFSQQFTNCNRCHQLKAFPKSRGETFTNYQYHNLGVPKNERVRAMNGLGADYVDRGLLEHPRIDDPNQAGKFKVSTLRNVAVTGPYMHNGVFKDLRTVVLFYDKFNNSTRTINPETGKPWRKPEVDQNLALEEEEFKARALTDEQVDALVAFMKTLTDQRYEHLIDSKKEQ